MWVYFPSLPCVLLYILSVEVLLFPSSSKDIAERKLEVWRFVAMQMVYGYWRLASSCLSIESLLYNLPLSVMMLNMHRHISPANSSSRWDQSLSLEE
ncbi:hypothetical protein CC77DRAFT_708690 [Alternaria alternata]|uniref:Uncharacterized protein n=1 Tax=Alternaria alternata TaxID=5599 RepID=A0A177DU87_ALTAL|nr:hypothetical protein CC77DRAFT_708690 [Alternaria alternata]OAG23305.1 hypothetical protein CC77DRAFT_708690 [Alternaria alternata]